MLHVGAHVRVSRAEGRVTGGHGGRREANQRDIGDNGTAGQSCRPVEDRREDRLLRRAKILILSSKHLKHQSCTPAPRRE